MKNIQLTSIGEKSETGSICCSTQKRMYNMAANSGKRQMGERIKRSKAIFLQQFLSQPLTHPQKSTSSH